MTPEQAIDAAVKIDSTRTYCVTCETWCYRSTGQVELIFRLAVIHGLDGTTCQHFQAAGIRECLADYRLAHEAVNAIA